jgi:hypothetical protein
MFCKKIFEAQIMSDKYKIWDMSKMTDISKILICPNLLKWSICPIRPISPDNGYIIYDWYVKNQSYLRIGSYIHMCICNFKLSNVSKMTDKIHQNCHKHMHWRMCTKCHMTTFLLYSILIWPIHQLCQTCNTSSINTQ